MKITQEDITSRFVSIYYELYRLRRVKSKTEFLEPLSIPPSNFAFIERGDRNCNLRQVCAVVTAYDINMCWLMTGKGKMFNCG